MLGRSQIQPRHLSSAVFCMTARFDRILSLYPWNLTQFIPPARGSNRWLSSGIPLTRSSVTRMKVLAVELNIRNYSAMSMKVVTIILFGLKIFMASVVAAGPSAMAAPTVVRIGATLPLSGRLALAGTDARQGIQLAIKDFSSPSLQLEVVFDDNQHDLRRAAASAHKLLSIDKVDVLISMWDVADVVAPMAEKK